MQPLLLLHGAIGSSSQFLALEHELKNDFKVYSLDFSGHGGSPLPVSPFSIELFAGNVLDFMNDLLLDHLPVFGYSMGGYVGMYLAKNFPERISSVIILATKFRWDESIAQKEVQMLNPERVAEKIPAFAETLQLRHAPTDWKEVLRKTAEMITGLGLDNPLKPADFTTINKPALVLLGDRDKMVGLDETLEVYKSLPDARLGILPGTPHQVEQVDVELLACMIRRFLT
jgi:pimeloyl-ACP methyl ester carboxylesterase